MEMPEDVQWYYMMSCSNLQGGLHVTQLRQPAGSDVVIACTAKRQLMLWLPNPGAAFRTFTARPTWYDSAGSSSRTLLDSHCSLRLVASSPML